MNPILRHTLLSRSAQKVSAYAASPLRRIASPLRPIGAQSVFVK